MHVTILAYGSRGDVQPYVALGVGLQGDGHTVRVAAPRPFEALITERGLEYAPLAGDPARLVRGLVDRAGHNLARIVRVMGEYTIPLALEVLADTQRACRGTDAVVHSFLMTLAGHQIAQAMGVPDFSALLYPIFARTSAFPNPMFPRLPLGGAYNRLTHDFFTRSFWQFSRLAYGWLRRGRPDLLPLPGWPFAATNPHPPPILYGFSPHVIAPPLDWGEHVHVTGYWFLGAAPGWQPPPDLLAFLEDGPPPVCVGFGSTIAEEMERLAAIALKALARTGQRGVLLTGWAGEIGGGGDDVFVIDAVPHEWLFPRAAAIVHHGGAGTTAAGLRAGVPAVVVPFGSDQPYWGRRVHALGAGPEPIPRRRLTVERLAEAIRIATGDAAMRRRAAELGQQIRAEDGVGRAVAIIGRRGA
jgi:sterol 3beta-glucosyltransferase